MIGMQRLSEMWGWKGPALRLLLQIIPLRVHCL